MELLHCCRKFFWWIPVSSVRFCCGGVPSPQGYHPPSTPSTQTWICIQTRRKEQQQQQLPRFWFTAGTIISCSPSSLPPVYYHGGVAAICAFTTVTTAADDTHLHIHNPHTYFEETTSTLRTLSHSHLHNFRLTKQTNNNQWYLWSLKRYS